ncbi:MAG: alpha-L-fucosidase [Verrucomicrobiota bacterium]
MQTSKATPFLVALLLATETSAQQDKSVETEAKIDSDKAWEAIDARPTPQWWLDAKFGIFIHWGPYSVPAFSKVGTYSEWYWEDLVNPKRKAHPEVKAFHDRVYGPLFSYHDFVPDFRAEMFEPKEWAEVFEDSGAKYVVLTSKHHDGYCLWPSEHANRSWGRAWNSVDSGPGRDLVGELTEAVNATDVRMGLYFSIYEWRNPLYLADPHLFVDRVLVPQFKEIVNDYKPATIFVDGEWDHPAEVWRSPEILTWLFNESPVKEEVVINDRWGKGDRHKHGGYYTTEYGAGLPNADNPWEENRGMAQSFGYSRTERFKDYNSSEALVSMLIDIVSRGGNFLLDIGPTADGRIPPLMEERLAEIGDWLEVNGEAIYSTTTHRESCQWTDGKVQDLKHGNYRVKYDVDKLLRNPDEGMARKEALFTRKGEALYAICPVFPEDPLVLKGIKAGADAKITFLGREGELEWKQDGDNLVITVPKMNPSRLPCDHAWTFKVSAVKN